MDNASAGPSRGRQQQAGWGVRRARTTADGAGRASAALLFKRLGCWASEPDKLSRTPLPKNKVCPPSLPPPSHLGPPAPVCRAGARRTHRSCAAGGWTPRCRTCSTAGPAAGSPPRPARGGRGRGGGHSLFPGESTMEVWHGLQKSLGEAGAGRLMEDGSSDRARPIWGADNAAEESGKRRRWRYAPDPAALPRLLSSCNRRSWQKRATRAAQPAPACPKDPLAAGCLPCWQHRRPGACLGACPPVSPPAPAWSTAAPPRPPHPAPTRRPYSSNRVAGSAWDRLGGKAGKGEGGRLSAGAGPRPASAWRQWRQGASNRRPQAVQPAGWGWGTGPGAQSLMPISRQPQGGAISAAAAPTDQAGEAGRSLGQHSGRQAGRGRPGGGRGKCVCVLVGGVGGSWAGTDRRVAAQVQVTAVLAGGADGVTQHQCEARLLHGCTGRVG